MKTTQKKVSTFFFILAGISCYFMINSYSAGPGTNGWDCTGAETGLSNPAGCSSGSGCHAPTVTAGIGLTLELDSAGVPTTHYKGGLNYTVKITGTNNTSSTLPRFGLQIGSIKGSVAVVTPVNAGTWVAPFPVSTHYAAPQAGNFVVGVVEQSTPISPTTGNGGNGSTYREVFNWKAPVQGTGTISLWAVLNAVNNDASADAADLWNLKHITIGEWPATTGISSAEEKNTDLNIFPNPAVEKTTVSYTLPADLVKCELRIMNIQGKLIDVIPVANGSTGTAVDCSKYVNGIYFYSLVINEAVVNTKKLIIAK